jgi:hypothetical protein
MRVFKVKLLPNYYPGTRKTGPADLRGTAVHVELHRRIDQFNIIRYIESH